MDDMQMTKQMLAEMPMHLLKHVNIETKDQEVMVQEELDRRLRGRENVANINLPASFTDSIQTKEQELALQGRLDAKQKSIKATMLGEEDEGLPETDDDELETTPDEVVGITAVTTPVTIKKFCDFCDAPGPYHKKVCTRPK